ncbi:hypothetical protein ADN00_16785 [Ornatilinea apprima]|uniref:HEAT repeat domain-containing protein n=1 Tax=Ornatilinea apprima TaxID=1134406 RepID=A0A0P6XPZ0_9CHLR|nr:hypothetical protein [Ornatilinea apprima]KPL71363.1 hypothetical protein ADN00_16785 [Ornatilinea apprima]
MSKLDEYQRVLSALTDWEPYLLEQSGLPGPRGNIELAMAFSKEGTLVDFQRLLDENPAQTAPVNDPCEFLAFCGAVGLGRCLAQGDLSQTARLRELANDPRWRMREAVCMALQCWGDVNMDALLDEMRLWAAGTCLEKRAAAAAICEPRLLKQAGHAGRVFDILERAMEGITTGAERKSEGYIALRKGLAYCWSVAVAAYPEVGKAAFERWLTCADQDARWVLKQNLTKNRLVKMDAGWVKAMQMRLAEGG